MSFSAEMKDFLNAYSTGQKINASRTDQDYKETLTDAQKKKTERDNDTDTLALQDEQARANLARTRDTMVTSAAQRAHLGATTAYTTVLAKRLNQPDPGSGLLPPSTGAVNANDPTNPTGATMSPGLGTGALPASTMDTEAYADGGLVPDNEDDEPAPDDESTETGAVPVNAPVGGPTDVSARARTPGDKPVMGLNGVISPALVHDATRAGLAWGANAYGLTGTGAIKSPSQKAQAALFAQGHGGLSDAEMQAAKKAVDPENKLTDSQRNMAALGSVYQYWANKGEGDKAEKVAFQMLQHYRNATTRYAAIAKQAAEGGDLPLAAKAAVKAYANVPDGRDLHIEPSPDDPKQLVYYYTDEKGNDIAKGLVTPQQLASSAMGLASGGFDKAILTAAGAREASPTAGAVGKPQTASDRAKEATLPDEPIKKMQEKWQEQNKDKPLDDQYWGDLKDATQHVLQQNPKTTPNEAAQAAMMLITPGKSDPEKPDFKRIPGEEGQPHTIKFNNGLSIKLDDGQLETVLNARAARVKAAVDKIDSDNQKADEPGFMDKAGDAGKKIGGAVAGVASDALPAITTMGRIARDAAGAVVPDELYQRGRAALSRVGDDVSRATRNKGAIPVDDGDRPL